MKIRTTPLLLLVLSFSVITAYGNDETKFIPKNYTGKEFSEKKYKPKSYSSEKTVRVKKYDESNKKRSFWNIFKRKDISEPKVLRDVKITDDKMFDREIHSAETVKRSQEKMLTDSTFKNQAGEPASEEFVPDNRPRARDPLLAPRQGVKAPVK